MNVVNNVDMSSWPVQTTNTQNNTKTRKTPRRNIIMFRAMTKPALMTFSNIEAINFYFNAKLTDAMFSYRFNIWLTYCPMYMDFNTHGYLLLHIL